MHPCKAFACLALLVMASQQLAEAATNMKSVKRSLLQAISNSDACLPTIPKCEPRACVNANVNGVAKMVCRRCSGNFESVTDDDGNIIQCVCPRGFYLETPNAASCVRCPRHSSCPGGAKVENPAGGLGPLETCGANMVTRNDGARSKSDCVSPAGYAQTTPGTATPCQRSEYAPAFNRLARCIRCQSGLEEPPNSGLNATAGARRSKRYVCMLPPGRFMSQGLVRVCPQSFYRENHVQFDAANGTTCTSCRPGITTDGAGSTTRAACNTVEAGYGISAVNVTSPTLIPNLAPLSVPSDGLPAATLCDFGYYSSNGRCVQCPFATVTRTRGATSVEQCMVPPGYKTDNTTLELCSEGEFREGWVLWSDQRGLDCTLCGVFIFSNATEADENPLAPSGSLVRAATTSCYIKPGQGIVSAAVNIFVGQECPKNTYGVAATLFGWASAPCKPCPRNMITDQGLRTNAADCVNRGGFGYTSEGSSQCAPGFYNARANMKPCQACPAGRTTADNPAQQLTITNCIVRPGFGVVDSNGAGLAAFAVDTTNLTPQMQASLVVLECPVGYYGVGGEVGSTCTQCPCGSTTSVTGARNATDCNVCLAGFGRATEASTVCTPCPYGTFQPGTGTVCEACPTTSFYPPVDGNGVTVTSPSTTLFDSAVSAEACVPLQSQLSPEAGQAYFTPDNAAVLGLTTVSTRATLTACFSACASNMCCLAQYNSTSQACRIATFAPAAFNAAASGVQLLYKLPLSAMGSASSVELPQPSPDASAPAVEGPGVSAKTIASGFYATCAVPAATAAMWQTAGTNLGPDARTFATGSAAWDTSSLSKADCQRRCDNSNTCWGFFFDAANNRCLYRGGVDALATRSFFVMPASGAGLQSNASQQCVTPVEEGDDIPPPTTPTCNPACASGLQCLERGQCGCFNNLTQCSNTCVNLNTSSTNCGSCGRTCQEGFRCSLGECRETPVLCATARSFRGQITSSSGTPNNSNQNDDDDDNDDDNDDDDGNDSEEDDNFSGFRGAYSYNVTIGTGGPNFRFVFNAHKIPDRFSIFLPNGTMIYTVLAGESATNSNKSQCTKQKNQCDQGPGQCQGIVSRNGFVILPRPVGVSWVRLVVNGYCTATAWTATVECAT